MGKFSKSQINWMMFISFLLSPIIAYRWIEEKVKDFLQISNEDEDPNNNF